MQFGNALAGSTFGEVGSLGAATLRLVLAAISLLAVIRPRVRGWSRRTWVGVTLLGLGLGGMNSLMYLSIERIPIGIAVTVELLGPLAVAIAGTRRARDLAWVALAALGVLALGLVLLARKGSGWGPVIGFCTALSVPILPTTIDNHRQFGVVAPVSLNGGVNLYLGNNPRMRQTAFLRPGLPFRQLILDADPATRNQAERDRYWRQRTRAEIAESPVAWLAVMGVKALWSVNDAEIPRNEDYRCRTRAGQPLAWMGRLPVRFGLLFPFAVLGAVVAVRHRNTLGEWTVLPALWLALHTPLVLFLVSDRYRLATWPVVVLMAVLGAWGLKERVLGRKASLGLLAGLGVLSLLPIDSRTAMDPAWCTYQEANLAYMQKDYPAAQEGYEAVVSHAGWEDDMGAHYWLGRLADLRKDRPAAMRHYDVVLQSYDDHYPTLVARADAAYYDGRKGEAADYLLRAYRVPGPRTSTGVKLVKLLRRLGREDEAEALMAADPKLANHPKLQ